VFSSIWDNVVNCSTVSRWSASFHEGRLSTEDNSRCGRPSTATDYTFEVNVNDILREDRRKTCEEIAHEARISVASFYRVITNNLKMRKVAARWVPHHLSDEQKPCHQRITEELLHRYQTEGMSPPDFDSFPKLKKTLRGKRFATIEEASTEVTRVI
jgi:hypothetical protein